MSKAKNGELNDDTAKNLLDFWPELGTEDAANVEACAFAAARQARETHPVPWFSENKWLQQFSGWMLHREASKTTPSLPPQGEAQADGDALPCPFCAAIAWVYEDWTHAVNCSGCKAQGPSHYDKGVAIDAWNRRAAIAPQGQQAKAVAVHVINNLARHHGHRHDPNGDYTFSLKQIHAFANAVAIAAQALPVSDTASADAPKQMFLVSFVGLRGERGIWREATEEEFHTFTPAYRRKVQVIDAAQALPVADKASACAYSNLTVEQRFAVRQSENIGASDSYFKERTHFMDTYANRNIFEAGFYRGWDAALQQTQESGAC